MATGIRVIPADPDAGADRSRPARARPSCAPRLPRLGAAARASGFLPALVGGTAARCTIASLTRASSKRDSRRRLPRDRRATAAISRSRQGRSDRPRGCVVYLIVWWTRSPVVEVGADRRDVAAGRVGGARRPNVISAGSIPGPVVIDEVLGMLDHAGVHSGRMVGSARRVRAVPRVRRHQAVSRRPVREAPRRPGHHGRRCDGGDLREHLPASLDVAACLPGSVDMSNPPSLRTAEIIAVGSELLGFDADRHEFALHR